MIDTMITADLLQRAVDFIGGFSPDRLTIIYYYVNIHVIFSSSDVLAHIFVDR